MIRDLTDLTDLTIELDTIYRYMNTPTTSTVTVTGTLHTERHETSSSMSVTGITPSFTIPDLVHSMYRSLIVNLDRMLRRSITARECAVLNRVTKVICCGGLFTVVPTLVQYVEEIFRLPAVRGIAMDAATGVGLLNFTGAAAK